ncbi:MAG: zinc ribbon domain-containing protein [Deltaproteobacteria bacterium]|nr:zinc ribbon domain-containing protein [Deltaproteobacteria bacterium]
MPTYEFKCEKCKKAFSMVRSISEHAKSKVACPKCKSKKVTQVISVFMAKTSRKS